MGSAYQPDYGPYSSLWWMIHVVWVALKYWRQLLRLTDLCPSVLDLCRAPARGSSDHIHTRISHSGSRAQYEGIPEIMFRCILMYVWSFGTPLSADEVMGTPSSLWKILWFLACSGSVKFLAFEGAMLYGTYLRFYILPKYDASRCRAWLFQLFSPASPRAMDLGFGLQDQLFDFAGFTLFEWLLPEALIRDLNMSPPIKSQTPLSWALLCKLCLELLAKLPNKRTSVDSLPLWNWRMQCSSFLGTICFLIRHYSAQRVWVLDTWRLWLRKLLRAWLLETITLGT